MTADGNAQFIVRSFYYDKKGNVIQTAEARQDVGTTSRISTKYGFTGNVLQSRETVDLPAAGGGSAVTNHLDKTFTYDSRVRLTDQTAQLTSGGTAGPQGSLGYNYDALGRNATLTRGTGTAADTTPYTYTVQGWLKTADGTTYSETLYYQDASNTSGLPGKAGLITEWTTLQKGTTADGGTTVSDTYAYEYDGAGRLTGSTRYSGSSSTALTTLTEKGITYDESGNLLTIKRYDASSATTPVDDLTFTYTGTKRTGYSYDTHGNMTADNINGTSITWNVIGLPKSISDNTNTARRVYAADGTLLAVYEGTSGTTGRVYVGSLDIMRASNGAFTVESAGWEGGRLLPGTGNDKVLYQITDHLGSVRVVKDGAGNVLQRIDYYPFGSVSAGWSSSTTPAQPTIRYRFSGKEIAGQSIGASAPAGTPAAAVGNPYLDFGARLYDPRTASWLAHDPLAEKYYGISPFAYCAGNPVNLIDPDGQDFLDKIIGLLIGVVTNIVPGSGYLRDLYPPNNTRDYNDALEITDKAAEAVGVLSVSAGSASTAVGTAMVAAGGGATLSVVGAPEGVAIAGAGVTVITESAELVLAGANLKANASANQAGGYNRGNGGSSAEIKTVNQLQEDIKKGKAPGKIYRVDKGNPNHGEQPHIHFSDGSALNMDGTWKHGKRKLYNAEREFLRKYGWKI